MTQILVAVANNAGQVIKAHAHWAKSGAAPARLPVKEGQTVVFQVDGQQQSGSALILGKRPMLRKVGKDLTVEVDGKAVVVLLEFFAVKGARLYGDEWALTPNQNLEIGPQGVYVRGQTDLAAVGVSGTTRDVAAVGMSGTTRDLAAVGVSGTTRDVAAVGVSGTTRDVAAVGVSGTTRDVAAVGVSGTTRDVAAVGVSGTTRDVAAVGVSGTTRDVAAVGVSGTGAGSELAAVGISGTKMATLAAGISLLPILGALGKGGAEDTGGSSQLSGSVVAGPVTEGLKVQIYKVENGNLVLLGTTDVAPGGRWSFDVKGHTGPVVVKVVDANGTGGNYLSELTGQAVDLNVSLIAVANLKAGANTLNITPVTTIAALKAGLAVDAEGAISNSSGLGLTSEKIDSNNSVVARALTLSNILTDEVLTTVDKTTGLDNLGAANAYGKVLAAIEGLGGNDQNKLESLAAMVREEGNNADWDLAAKHALVTGAANVELERQQAGLLTAVAALVTRSTSDGRLLIAPLGNNNIITDESRGAFQLRVTAPTQTTELVIYINGEPIELAAADLTNDGNGHWTANLSSQSWPYGPNELKVEAMLSGGQAAVSTTQLFSVVDPQAPTLPFSDWDQIIQVAGMTDTSTVNGGDGHDFFRVSAQSGRSLELRGQAGHDAFQFLGANVGNFTVDGGAGNDSISLSALSTGLFTLLLGEGDDSVDAGAMTVGLSAWDGAGSDALVLGSGNDTVHVENDATNDRFNGGAGADVLTYASHSAGLTFNINFDHASGGKDGRVFRADASNINDLFYGFESFVGGTGDDIFNLSHVTTLGGVSTTGGAGTDVLRYVSATTSDLTVRVTTPGPAAEGCAGTVSSASGTNHFDGIERIYTGKGNDAFFISGTSVDLKVNTGTGNDTITLSALRKDANAGGMGFTAVWSVFDWSGDVLNLQGFWDPGTVNASNIGQYVKISSTTRTLAVDMDGTGGAYRFWDLAVLSGGHENFTSLSQLFESGHLIISA
jgi:hypothetical protein